MNDPRHFRTPCRVRCARRRSGRFPGGVLALALVCSVLAAPAESPPGAAPVDSTPGTGDLVPVLAGPGPWNDTPIAPGRRNIRLVLEYDAEPGTNAVVSLQGWKRLLPVGQNQRAEFAIEDADGSPFILRHWRAGRERPDSTERPRPDDPAAAPDIRLTAGSGFRLRRAFVQPLRDLDHADWWARADENDTARGAALYRDHCLACHGDATTPAGYPGLTSWNDRDRAASVAPFDLWLALNRQDGHPRLSEAESYQVVRYLRDILLAPRRPEIAAPLPAEALAALPRGRVLVRPPDPDPAASAPWRRMDHGPFLFHPLEITGEDDKPVLRVENALITRLNPGIGGVTAGRLWAIHDTAPFRFLGFARGGQFSDRAVIFDGSDAPGLTLARTSFEKADPTEPAAGLNEMPTAEQPASGDAIFRGLAVSNREITVLFSLGGRDFRESFQWQENGRPVRRVEPHQTPIAPGAPDPVFSEFRAPAPPGPDAEIPPLFALGLPAPEPARLPSAPWLRFTAIAAAPDGTLALATLNGEIWAVSPPDTRSNSSRWRRFAGGLDAPYRLAYTGRILEARCRNGTFRLHDENNDGFCERYEPAPAPAPAPAETPAAALAERLSRFAAPARTADNTWYFALPATGSNPGAGLVRRDARSPVPEPAPQIPDPENPDRAAPAATDPEVPIYAWMPGAQSVPPAGPLWLAGAGKWGPGLQSGTLWPCRDTGLIYRLWSANPGDLSLPRVLWSLPIPPLETDITGAVFVGPTLYLCGLPLEDPDAATPVPGISTTPGLWRVTRRAGHLFHPVEFSADDQSITLRFNAPIDAAATASDRRLRIAAWPQDQATEPAPVAPRRVLLGRNTLRVVSDAIRPGGGCTLVCGVADADARIHPFTIHFTLPDDLPRAVLPAPRPRPLPAVPPPGEASGNPDGIDPAIPVPPGDSEALPTYEWPDRLPELDDPVEEEPLPTR